ncbi:MAG: NADH-quinone oxidoreductase subunit C [Burkholderiaceae bacterium]|jgi:NADH-quinone oxidoreductase subunit C
MPDTPASQDTAEATEPQALVLTVAGQLAQTASAKLGGLVSHAYESLGEVTVEAPAASLVELGLALRDTPGLEFDTLIDLCGMDYMGFKEGRYEGPRFAVVVHLLSVVRNQRIRLKIFCPDDDLPQVPSLVSVWPGSGWYEREAFDLYGIVFAGHNDLRRILTDYGFVGHPFRKDFPTSGYVEMRYDAQQRRVVYQPVTIEPRDITPRVVREEHYGRA